MRELLLVASREFTERVRTRSFVIGTALLPMLVLAMIALPGMRDAERERRLVLVDEAPDPIGQTFVVSLNSAFIPTLDSLRPARRGGSGIRYRIEVIRQPLDSVRAALTERLNTEQIDGYVVLPADLRESGRVQFRSAGVNDPLMLRDVRVAATEAVQADRLARSGLQLDRVAALLTPVTVDGGRAADEASGGSTSQASFYFAYTIAMVIYLMIALYGTGVTRSVLEEKNNRIAEVLVSSMRASDLLGGKILGVGAAVLLQVALWLAIFALLVTQSQWLAERFSIDPGALRTLVAHPGTTALLVAYFILGFLVFAAMFAALGAAVTSDQEAQAYQMLLMIPLFVPLLFLMQLTAQPLQPLARLLGLLPLTSPVAMPMRMAAARIPLGDVLLSLTLLVLTLAAVAWIAGKIYRIGILSTGRKPTLRELIRWIGRS